MDPFHRLLSYSAYVSAPDKGAIHHNCDATFIEAFDSLQASHTRSTDTSFNMDLSLRKALISYRDVEQLLIPRAIDQWKTISTRYDFEYWRRQLMARRQMVRDRFRRTVHKLALKDKLKIKEHTDPFARFIGARSPELRAAVQKTITKERKHFMRQIFQYAVRREVMRRRAANPGSDPWNSFFFNAYRLAKPVREETSSQRHKMNLRTSIRRKLSTAPAMLQASIEEVEDDAPLSSSSSSNILLHDQTVFQVFSSFALHSLTGDDKVESAAVRVSSSSLSSETSPPPRLRPPTPPSTAGGVRRLSRSRERRLQIQLQSRDVGRDGQVVETIEIVHHYGGERRKAQLVQ
uniref:Uncharacterized protein n=1 Tax=Plectus sambesii TaxID=2011161 RepID=A0A914UKN5_9BILA